MPNYPIEALLRAQMIQRYGREPVSKDEQVDALALCDKELVGRVALKAELEKIHSRPLSDSRSFGGNRLGDGTAIPLSEGGDEDAVDRAGLALNALDKKLLKASRESFAAGRDDDFRRGRGGGVFAKERGSTAARLAADLEEISMLLKTDPGY